MIRNQRQRVERQSVERAGLRRGPLGFRFEKSSESETSLRQRARDWPHHAAFESLTAETLRQITEREGVDFATALLFERLRKVPKHAKLVQRLDSLRRRPVPASLVIDARVVIVPGALYLERPEMGGDGRLVREVAGAFGCQTDLIRLASFGSVTNNARLIRAWLQQHSSERLILVSLSKGASDLKLALSSADAPSQFGNIIAWVNVGGPLDGSRMANWILASRWRTWFFRLKFRVQRRDFDFISDLRTGGPLGFSQRLPASMRVLSLIGFPLERHMTTSLSRFCHRTLAVHGPNDGTTSLCDLQTWPGEIYPAWGMDHYFRPENEARGLVRAVFQYLAEELETCLAVQPN